MFCKKAQNYKQNLLLFMLQTDLRMLNEYLHQHNKILSLQVLISFTCNLVDKGEHSKAKYNYLVTQTISRCEYILYIKRNCFLQLEAVCEKILYPRTL